MGPALPATSDSDWHREFNRGFMIRFLGNYDLTYHGLKAIPGGFERIGPRGCSGDFESAHCVSLGFADSSRFSANLKRHVRHGIACLIVDNTSDGPNFERAFYLHDELFGGGSSKTFVGPGVEAILGE
jgi:hypothetical protein